MFTQSELEEKFKNRMLTFDTKMQHHRQRLDKSTVWILCFKSYTFCKNSVIKVFGLVSVKIPLYSTN